MLLLIMLLDEHGPQSLLGKIIMLLVCSLGAVATMLNMGGNSASAKEAFWTWVIFSVGCAIAGFIGWAEILLFVMLT